MAKDETIKVKVCLVGEAAVGKTSLIRRFVTDQFDDRYISTLGAKVSKKELQVVDEEKDTTYSLVMMIWDVMGEKHIRDLLREAFFSGAQGIVAVSDLTRYSTLRELDGWVKSVYEVVPSIPVVYAINKVDLKEEVLLMFGEDEVAEAASTFDAPYFYASARTGENVQEIFETLAHSILARHLSKDLPRVGT